MARNGSGSYSLPEAAFVYDTVIDEVAMNNNLSDIATALTGSIAADGQTTITGNLPMSGYRHTGVGNGSARNHYAAIGQIQDGGLTNAGTAGGTADALTVALTPAITAYATGMRFWFTASANNTGADPTINVNSVGAKTLKDMDGASIDAGFIVNGSRYLAFYDGTDVLIQREAALVTGPASTTENNVPQWDSTTKQLKDGLSVGSGSGSLLRTDGDGSSLTGVTDTVARDRAMSAYIKADINANDPAGVYGDLISDNFISDTLSTKTNATYDATGDYYSNLGSPTQISQATGTNIGNMTGGGGVAASFDGNTNQSDGAGSQISATSGWVGKNWGTTYQVSQARVWRPNNAGIDGVAGSGTITVTIEGSATGSWGGEEVSLGSNTATDYDGARGGSSQSSDDAPSSYDYIEVDVTPTSYAYHRAVVSGAGTEVRIAEVQFFEPGTPTNMTLQPSSTTLATADPTDITVYFRVEDIDSVTEETDRIVKVSIDNGSTLATCSITVIGAWGADDTLIRADGDVSGQTGSSYVWQLTTANNKEQRIKQVVSAASY